MARFSLKRERAFGWLIPGVLVILALAVFWRAASLQGIFFFGDIFRLHYPERAAFLHSLARRQWPLWTSNLLAGYPLLAEGQFGPFYPVNWLLHALLPVDAALNYHVIAHYIWAGLTMYGLARLLRLSRWASLLAGIVYMFSGFCIAHLNHLNIVAVVSWMPALFAASRLMILRLRQGWHVAWGAATWMAICLAMILLAGHPQMALLSIGLILADALWQTLFPDARISQPRVARMRYALLTGVAFLGTLALAGGLAAVQLLPSYELTQLSERAGGLEPEFFASFSLHPGYLVLLISPFLLGNPYPHLSVELVSYIGLLPLLLAITTLLIHRERSVRFYVVIALLSLALALGRWNPLYIVLLRVPLFNWFRVPARFLSLFALAMALLAGMGAEALAKRLRDVAAKSRARQVFGPVVVALGLAILVWLNTRISLDKLLLLWRYWPLLQAILAGVLLVAAWRGWLSKSFFQGACLLLVIADTGAFAAVYNQTYNATMTRSEFRAEPRSLSFLQADQELYRIYTHEEIVPVLSVMRESFYPNIALLHDIQAINGYLPLIPTAWARFRERLSPRKLNMLNVKYVLLPQLLPVDEASEFYDVEDPFAPTLVGRAMTIPPLTVCSLVVESYVSHSVDMRDGELAAEVVLEGEKGESSRLPLRVGLETAEWAYERSDVRAHIRHTRPAVARSWPARSGFPPEDHVGMVFRAEYALPEPLTVAHISIQPRVPRAFLRVERVLLIDEAGKPHPLSHLLDEGDHTLVYRSEDVAIYQNYDVLPRAYLVHRARVITDEREVLMEVESESFDPAREVILDAGAPLQEETETSGRVEITSYTPQRVVIHTSAARDGYLVLSDAFYPGWQATVDGRPVPIRRANGYFRAVYVPAGEHMVEHVYRAHAFLWGCAISACSIVVCIALVIWRHIRFRVNE